tara:strand:- start:4963 stop:5448 length:486 start_codon:yes stop_codon:yes gene_type:complete
MTLHPLAGELSLVDEAVVRYHSKGWKFVDLLDEHLNYRAPDERYIFSGPNYLLLGEAREDDEGRFWLINYAAVREGTPMGIFFKFAPYKLDRVAFSRYRHISKDKPEIYKFYKWERLYESTKNTTTSSTATATSSTTSASSTSSEAGSEASVAEKPDSVSF